MKTKKSDFVELDFVAKIKGDGIFDTTNYELALKEGLIRKEDTTAKDRLKPLKVCIGEGMVVKGLDKELEDKELNKDYSIELTPENSFGKRIPNLIRTFPLNSFKSMPQQGMLVNVDGNIARVISVNSGRVTLDFNNPLAGKDIVYDIKIKRIIEDKKEKVETLLEGYGIEIKSLNISENKGKIELKEKYPKQILDEIAKKINEKVSVEIEFA